MCAVYYSERNCIVKIKRTMSSLFIHMIERLFPDCCYFSSRNGRDVPSAAYSCSPYLVGNGIHANLAHKFHLTGSSGFGGFEPSAPGPSLQEKIKQANKKRQTVVNGLDIILVWSSGFVARSVHFKVNMLLNCIWIQLDACVAS